MEKFELKETCFALLLLKVMLIYDGIKLIDIEFSFY
jgi:hypothetical protein